MNTSHPLYFYYSCPSHHSVSSELLLKIFHLPNFVPDLIHSMHNLSQQPNNFLLKQKLNYFRYSSDQKSTLLPNITQNNTQTFYSALQSYIKSGPIIPITSLSNALMLFTLLQSPTLYWFQFLVSSSQCFTSVSWGYIQNKLTALEFISKQFI